MFLSPTLLILFPAAGWMKRRHIAKLRQSAHETATAVLAERDRQGRAATEASKLEAAEKAARLRVQEMMERLKADPVSAVLRRQVPVRFEEPARSWLGDLPQMPEHIQWPRGGTQNRPLHFAAQICCADLPDRLWRGKGPREGWLLLFIDGYRIGGGGLDDDGDSSAVIFIDKLGSERRPPDDLHGVQDLLMSGASYPQAIEQKDVPVIWRKWPIDIVEQEQQVEFDKVAAFTNKPFAPVQTTTEDLYEVATQPERPQLDPKQCPPLTWQGVLDFVKAVKKQQRKRANQPVTDQTLKLREEPDWLSRMIMETETVLSKRTKMNEGFAAEWDAFAHSGVQSPEEATRQAFLERKLPVYAKLVREEEQTLQQLQAYETAGGEAALASRIEKSLSELPVWWGAQGSMLDELQSEIEAKDVKAAISKEEWLELRNKIASIRCPFIDIRYRGSGEPSVLKWDEVKLQDAVWTGDLLTQHYLDLYVQSPDARALIPDYALEAVEAIARAIGWNRPHRMGGLADPLQSDIGPNDPPLLFQIASDDCMNWMWGDAGATYIVTNVEELDTRQSNGFAKLECH